MSALVVIKFCFAGFPARRPGGIAIFDVKVFTLTTLRAPIITSPLIVYGVENSGLTYIMAETGVSYYYNAYPLPSNLILTGNFSLNADFLKPIRERQA